MKSIKYNINKYKYFSPPETDKIVQYFDDILNSEHFTQTSKDYKELSSTLTKFKDLNRPDYKLKVGFIGQFSSGKTTVINSLLGFHLGETGDLPVTKNIFKIKYDPQKISLLEARKSIVEYIVNGRSNEPIPYDEFNNKEYDRIKKILNNQGNYYFNVYINKNDITVNNFYTIDDSLLTRLELIDTPGFGSEKNEDQSEAVKILPELDVIIYVKMLSGDEIFTESEFEFILNNELHKKELIILFNCHDCLMNEDEINVKLYGPSGNDGIINALKSRLNYSNDFHLINGNATYKIKNNALRGGDLERFNRLLENKILTKDLNEVIMRYVNNFDYYINIRMKYKMLNYMQHLYMKIMLDKKNENDTECNERFSDELNKKKEAVLNEKKDFMSNFRCLFLDPYEGSWFKNKKIKYDIMFDDEVQKKFFYEIEMFYNKTSGYSNIEEYYLLENNFNDKHQSDKIEFTNALKQIIFKYISNFEGIPFCGDNEVLNFSGCLVANPIIYDHKPAWYKGLNQDQKNNNQIKLKDYIESIFEIYKSNIHSKLYSMFERYYQSMSFNKMITEIDAEIRDNISRINITVEKKIQSKEYTILHELLNFKEFFDYIVKRIEKLKNSSSWDKIKKDYCDAIDSAIRNIDSKILKELSNMETRENNNNRLKIKEENLVFINNNQEYISF